MRARLAWVGLAIAFALAAPALRAQELDHPTGKPLVVGSDFGIAPWMVRGTGGPEGFGVDMVNEIAKRLGRPGVEIVDVNFSGLFAALFAKRMEFTVNPLNITAERAERMLYTEPFFATGNGFLVRAAEEMKGLEDLKGKAVAVNRGTISDTWATANAERLGFEVQRYDTFPDFRAGGHHPARLRGPQRDPDRRLRGEPEPRHEGRLQGLHRAELRLCVPAGEPRIPQQGGGGDRVHEARRHPREAAREVVRLGARPDVFAHGGLFRLSGRPA